jgi:hypothetical protein
MTYTFDTFLEKVINNKSLSRKEKLNALRAFLKTYSGDNKPKTEEDAAALANLKAIKQTYTQQEANEKIKDKQDKTSSSFY